MPLRFASKLNVDGYFTVDYYVTAVFFSSLIMACVVRQYHPYKMMRIVYTEKMWADGKDSFLDKKSQTFKEIDMYEWVHLSQLARARHLKDYARRISTKVIKDELDRQKKSRDAVKEKAAEEKKTPEEKKAAEEKKATEEKAAEEKTRSWCCCISATQKKQEEGTDVEMMEKEYYNQHAKLIVKVIKEITESTVSPPHRGDQENLKLGMAKGTAVCKKVVVRPNSVGTIIDQVNDDLVKIRFPKEVLDPPVSKGSLPKVSIEKESSPKEEVKGSLPQVSEESSPKEEAKGSLLQVPMEEKSSPKEEGDEISKNMKEPKKKLVCFKSGAPIAIIDKNNKFEDDKLFANIDADLRESFKNGTKKIERQYHMTLTPNFDDDAQLKHKVNAWHHNAVLRMVKPRPRHMLKGEDVHDHETKRENEATKWEDVVVPLDAIIKASVEWKTFEEELDEWIKDKKKAEAALEVVNDQKDAEVAP